MLEFMIRKDVTVSFGVILSSSLGLILYVSNACTVDIVRTDVFLHTAIIIWIDVHMYI